jgi:hypothetical protein
VKRRRERAGQHAAGVVPVERRAVDVGQRPLDEPPDRDQAQTDVAGTRGAQDGPSGLLGQADHLGRQPGLADAGGALDDPDPGCAPVHEPAGHVELGGPPAESPRTGGRRCRAGGRASRPLGGVVAVSWGRDLERPDRRSNHAEGGSHDLAGGAVILDRSDQVPHGRRQVGAEVGAHGRGEVGADGEGVGSTTQCVEGRHRHGRGGLARRILVGGVRGEVDGPAGLARGEQAGGEQIDEISAGLGQPGLLGDDRGQVDALERVAGPELLGEVPDAEGGGHVATSPRPLGIIESAAEQLGVELLVAEVDAVAGGAEPDGVDAGDRVEAATEASDRHPGRGGPGDAVRPELGLDRRPREVSAPVRDEEGEQRSLAPAAQLAGGAGGAGADAGPAEHPHQVASLQRVALPLPRSGSRGPAAEPSSRSPMVDGVGWPRGGRRRDGRVRGGRR